MTHPHRIRTVVLALVVLTISGSAGASRAADFEFLFSKTSVQSDKQLFMNLTVRSSRVPRPTLEPLLPRIDNVDADLPVILFLAMESRRSADWIVDLRAMGLSWSVIFSRCQVSHDLLFTGIDRDPGPPYGRAWGHWKKRHKSCKLSDRDIAGLVHVQLGHRIAGVSPLDLARGCGTGRSVAFVVANKKGRSYPGAKAGHDKGDGHDRVAGNDKHGYGKGR